MKLSCETVMSSHQDSCQNHAPLLQQLQMLANQSRAAFHTPGHKQGQGSPIAVVELLRQGLRADLPELPELDNLFTPAGVIAEAQHLAAQTFGADRTWFLANGSTCGIEAAVLATCNPGDRLILPRNVHQSVIAALILSGAIPVWLPPVYDLEWGLVGFPTPKAVRQALETYPEAKAVLLVSPTYEGISGDLASIAAIVHQFGIPLLVDEAHGAHLGFHPDLPASALASGADLAIQSTHKTLSALTQAAMLHLRGDRINPIRLSRALQLVQSTSPNYLLLASLDGARQQMAVEGQDLMQQALDRSDRARQALSQMVGLRVLSIEAVQAAGLGTSLDPTRLTINVSGLGLTGFAADEILHQQLGVTVELPALHHVTCIVTAGNSDADIDRLIQACQQLSQIAHPGSPNLQANASQAQAGSIATPPFQPAQPMIKLQSIPILETISIPDCSPRTAFFAASQVRPIETAIGHLSGELICPYPPGIPVLLPGEPITGEAVRYLQQVLASGGMVTGCADPSLATLQVLC